MEIAETSVQNLQLNYLKEVYGIASTKTLPERLQFEYKNNESKQLPMLLFVKEGFTTLRLIHSSMKMRRLAIVNASNSDKGVMG